MPEADWTAAFAGLCEAEKFADVFINVDGERIPAHKAVLYARSPYFARMFAADSDLREAQIDANEVTLLDIPSGPFRAVLRFWYCGQLPDEIESDPLELLEVLKLADYFQADEIVVAAAEALEKSLCLRSSLRLLGVAHQRVHLAKGGKCVDDDLWSHLWRCALELVQKTLSGTEWLCQKNIRALEEIWDTYVAHLALRFISPDIAPPAAQAILHTLATNLDLREFTHPFRQLDFSQTEASAEVEFSREHWASEEILGDYLSAELNLLGCLQVQCKVYPNGKVMEAVSWNWGMVKTWISDRTFVCDDEGLYSVVPTARTTLRCGDKDVTKEGFNLVCFLDFLMTECRASVIFELKADPPPIAQVLVKGGAFHLQMVEVPSSSFPISLPLNMLHAALAAAKSAPPLRLVEVVVLWAERQPDPHLARKQLQGLLEGMPVQVSLWDLMESAESLEWPLTSNASSRADSGRIVLRPPSREKGRVPTEEQATSTDDLFICEHTDGMPDWKNLNPQVSASLAAQHSYPSAPQATSASDEQPVFEILHNPAVVWSLGVATALTARSVWNAI
eukprot:TRINITY_DN93696_c0_g1_i1.p1 TRINITY_DN93696_c0_g1~~TRINITY_DN93696_c0_g1_i1.p1  ORF type:complete len:580 (+),score=122.76 TRINITY_DN93696_c0_g1_i1:49-1740(+)